MADYDATTVPEGIARNSRRDRSPGDCDGGREPTQLDGCRNPEQKVFDLATSTWVQEQMPTGENLKAVVQATTDSAIGAGGKVVER